MVIDTSALAAIFFGSQTSAIPECDNGDRKPSIVCRKRAETGIVLEGRQGEAAGREFDLFVVRADLQIVSVDAEQAEIARLAWRKYGKGRHPAGLNMGDCITYALCKSSGEPLLAKGTDFALTDIEMCHLPPQRS